MSTSFTTQLVPGVLICARCPERVVATAKHLAEARTHLASSTNAATVARAGDPNNVATVAARYTARDIGWKTDHDGGNVGLCASCAVAVAAQRKSPCPPWCSDCQGYDFFSQGTTHQRCWRSDDGVLLAEVTQNVPFAAEDGWTVATLFHEGPEEKSLVGLRAVARIAAEVADFIEAYGIVVTEGGE